jgi:UPF0176 protein
MLMLRQFNALIEDPDTVLVDMRNHYESEIGHFKNAITPDVDTFRESLDLIEEDLKAHKEDKKLVMYCTGGIRCEKASAYYKHKGFKNVFQLEGGIINYARQVEADGLENKFIGKNFVFDQRRSERISEDVIANAINVANQQIRIPIVQMKLAIYYLFNAKHVKKKWKIAVPHDCQEIIKLPYEEQKALRKGQGNSNDIFKKGRADHLPYKKDLRNIFEGSNTDAI